MRPGVSTRIDGSVSDGALLAVTPARSASSGAGHRGAPW